MQKEKFFQIRKRLNKTQKEMAALLGVSIKTVESYEQGLRNIPPNVERIVYFLLFKLNMEKFIDKKNCWEAKKCPGTIRDNCIAWAAKEGFFCWFLTGKVCAHEVLISGKSTGNCFQCSFFKDNLKGICDSNEDDKL